MEPTEKQPEEPQKNKPNEEDYFKIVKPLRTYERDVAEKVREGDTSMVSVHLEERKRGIPEESLERLRSVPKIVKIKVIFIAALGLLVVGAGSFTLFKLFSATENMTVTPEDKGISIVKADYTFTLDISGKDREGIVSAIEEGLGTPPSGLRVTNFLLTEKNILGITRPLSPEKFFSKLSSFVPPGFLRATGPILNVGFLTFSNKKEGFIISEIESFENAFDGMLDWEKNLVTDLKFLVTSGNDVPLGNFRDAVIQDKDSRILRDRVGRSILIYSFIEKNVLLIARNEETFEEISNRYLSAKLGR